MVKTPAVKAQHLALCEKTIHWQFADHKEGTRDFIFSIQKEEFPHCEREHAGPSTMHSQNC